MDGLSYQNTCGNSNDRVTEQHDQRGDKLPHRGYRRDVAIAYRGDGHHRPVDCRGDARHGGILAVLKHVDGGSEDDGGDKDEKHENQDACRTAAHHIEQVETLLQEALHPEDAEDTQCTEHTEHGEGLRGGNEQTQIGGENGEEVDNAIKGEDILPGTLQAVDTQVVLQREDNGENPFQTLQNPPHIGVDRLEAVEDDDHQIASDENQQPDIKALACRRVGLEDDTVDLFLGDTAVALGHQHMEYQPMEEIAHHVYDLAADTRVVQIQKEGAEFLP